MNVVGRRSLLRHALQFTSFAALAPLVDSARGAASCVDSSSESLRSSLHYKSPAPDPKQACSACGFFTKDTASSCGSCMIMSGPVDATGHCDSWSAKG